MTTQGMWQMLSDLLDGEKLPDSLNKDIYDLCEGKAVVVCNSIEPVAWMSQLGTCYSVEDIEEMEKNIANNFKIPLYTHPMRELTDGEILNIYLEQTNGNKDLDILEFARAILKKASEK
jgi:hypothetical protein